MISISATIEAAKELEQGKAPSVKLALWAVALSPNQELEKNGLLVELLRPYVRQDLPENHEELYHYLKQSKGLLFTSHINALYHIEQAERDGLLDGLEEIGYSDDYTVRYTLQCLWREKVREIFKGKGLGYKTISFAALILDPLHCEIVPVDRHVQTRLRGKVKNGLTVKQYLEIEQEVIQERASCGMAHIPLGIYHWYKWDEQRSSHSRAYKGNGGIESHKSLSCRLY